MSTVTLEYETREALAADLVSMREVLGDLEGVQTFTATSPPRLTVPKTMHDQWRFAIEPLKRRETEPAAEPEAAPVKKTAARKKKPTGSGRTKTAAANREQ